MALNSIYIDDGSKSPIYSVDKACSFNNQCPIAIVPGRETRDNIKDIVDAMDIGIFQGKNNQHTIDFGTFTAVFRIYITMSQVDTKMIKMITELTGAYCTSCSLYRQEVCVYVYRCKHICIHYLFILYVCIILPFLAHLSFQKNSSSI